ncbi:MAG: hypothetical protein HKM03_01590, partial [Steroidobacteraceae bacterium]|nr:hypothetical protein [Steroidobacteraceae bacterium]
MLKKPTHPPLIAAALATLALLAAPAHARPAGSTAPPSTALPAPMDAPQVITLLDRTLQWYRAQRAGRDIASRPSDW